MNLLKLFRRRKTINSTVTNEVVHLTIKEQDGTITVEHWNKGQGEWYLQPKMIRSTAKHTNELDSIWEQHTQAIDCFTDTPESRILANWIKR